MKSEHHATLPGFLTDLRPKPVKRTWLFLYLYLWGLGCLSGAPTLDGKDGMRESEWLRDLEAVLALNPDWTLYRCRGDSMEPILSDGDIVILQRGGFVDLGVGMLAAYRCGSGLPVLHQIVAESDDGFIMRGKGNPKGDRDLLDASNFLGSVVGIFRSKTFSRWQNHWADSFFRDRKLLYCLLDVEK